MYLGGNAWLGAGCALGGGRAPCESLIGRALDAFGQGHHDRSPDGLHARGEAVTAHVGQRVHFWLELAGAQSFPETTTVWLPEMEALYGVPLQLGLTDEQRRGRYAVWRRGTDGHEDSIRAAVRELVPDAETFTVTWQQAAAAGAPEATWTLGVLVHDAWGDERVMTDVRATLRRQKPQQRHPLIARHREFRCNSPRSLCDTDLLSI